MANGEAGMGIDECAGEGPAGGRRTEDVAGSSVGAVSHLNSGSTCKSNADYYMLHTPSQSRFQASHVSVVLACFRAFVQSLACRKSEALYFAVDTARSSILKLHSLPSTQLERGGRDFVRLRTYQD